MKSSWMRLSVALVVCLGVAGATAGGAMALELLNPGGEAPTESKPITFTGTISGSTFEGPGSRFMECTEGSVSGEFIGKTALRNIVVTFHGCRFAGGYHCNDEGTLEGEKVVTKVLTGEIGFIDKATNKVGIRFGAARTGLVTPAWTEEIQCYPIDYFTLEGEVIAALTPVEKFTSTLTATAEQAGDEQKLIDFEGEFPAQRLFWFEHHEKESITSNKTGLQSTITLTKFTQNGLGIEVMIRT